MQNSNLIFAVGGLFLLISAFYIYKRSNKSTVAKVANNTSLSESPDKVNNEKRLTMQERIELSWKFLYEITELIINKFSKEDINSVNKLGHVLLNNGMRYEHVVDLGMQRTISTGKKIEKTQSPKNLSK